VIEITTSKTGKHGHAKANITALDVFTAKKYEEIAPTSHSVQCPFVKSNTYQLLDIGKNGQVSLMAENGDTREDVNMPGDEELAARIKELFDAGKTLNVVVVSAMNIEAILSFKEETA